MKSKVYIIFLFFVLAINIKSLAQVYTPNTWDAVSTSGLSGLMFSASFTIGTTIYVCTGRTGTTPTTTFWAYNTISNTWNTTLMPFPGAARNNAVGFSINGMGYIGLGDNGASNFFDFYQYNPATNSWSNVASLPTTTIGTSNTTSFTIDGKGYVCSGGSATPPYTTYNYLYEYDPGSNTWTSKASYPDNRSLAMGFVINNIAYVGSGYNSSTIPLSSFYSYNPTTGLWSAITPLPVATAYGAAFSTCDYGYAGMGTEGISFYQYDPSHNIWNSMNNYPGSGVYAFISAGINVGTDTAFGFVGFGESASSTSVQDFFKYYPPTQCINPFPAIVGNVKTANDLAIFPNPATDIITIKSSSKTVNYQLCDMFGKTVIQSIIAQNEFEINTAYLNSGVYLLKIIYGNGQTEVRKICKI